MPFWQLYTFPRYLPELKTISERLEEFFVVYLEGSPQEQWFSDLMFRKVRLPFAFVKSKVIRFFLSKGSFCSQVRDIDVDLIYSMGGTWEQEASRYLSEKMGVPYVVRLRGDSREVRKAVGVNPVKRRILDYSDMRSLRQADLVIPISKALAEKVKMWGVDEAKVASPVSGGVDTDMFRPMKVDRSSDFTVAYAGRLSLEKGVLRLLEMARKLTDVHFIVAGSKEVDVSFPSNVDYLGRLQFPEMPDFYNKADLVILPSFTEGFPYAILEAYACGKPVLATPEAFPEELKVFGSVVGIEEFPLEINCLRTANLKAVVRDARQYVKEHFIWDRFGELIVRLLENLVSNPNSD